MFDLLRRNALAISLLFLVGSLAMAQQQVPQGVPQQQAATQPLLPKQAAPQQPAPLQVPQGFTLNALEQTALDQVLDAWQAQSGKINTFKCSFERWEYNVAFGPGQNIPLSKDKGELSYQKPDKGSFQITEVNKFQAQQSPAGQQPPAQIQGNWVKQPEAIGEHWVCDGKSVFEYRHDQKQLVERPIPPQMQGQAIVDGPLPFLFGAEAAKLKQRYWLKIDNEHNNDPKKILITAKPRSQAQAADFTQVDVFLNRERLMPEAMQVTMPNGSRHVYIFDTDHATVNGAFDRLKSMFDQPRVPFGWKRVVENAPVAEVPQGAPATR
jgi:TIGR03009 family protein